MSEICFLYQSLRHYRELRFVIVCVIAHKFKWLNCQLVITSTVSVILATHNLFRFIMVEDAKFRLA